MRVAILIFGQPRFRLSYNYNLNKLNHLKTSHPGLKFTTFIHTWSCGKDRYPFSPWAHEAIYPQSNFAIHLEEAYKPEILMIEKQKFFNPKEYLHPQTCRKCPNQDYTWTDCEISNMISQLSSISKVCSLPDDQYDMYILTRFDCDIPEDLDLLSLDRTKIYHHQDFLEIFDHAVLERYSKLMTTLRTIPCKDGIDSETLRWYSLDRKFAYIPNCALIRSLNYSPIFIDEIKFSPQVSFVNSENAYIRKTNDDTFICKFPPKNKTSSYQWVGLNRCKDSRLSFRIKFSNPISFINEHIGTKIRDKIDNSWLKNINHINEWYEVCLEVPKDETCLIFCADEYLNEKEIHFELQLKN